jgi:hypothetical protein
MAGQRKAWTITAALSVLLNQPRNGIRERMEVSSYQTLLRMVSTDGNVFQLQEVPA